MPELNASRALARHAHMTGETESGVRPLVVVGRRASRMNFQRVVISDDARAQYHFELTEHAGRLMDAGYSEQEADMLAVAELGCLEFWDFLNPTETDVQTMKVAA